MEATRQSKLRKKVWCPELQSDVGWEMRVLQQDHLATAKSGKKAQRQCQLVNTGPVACHAFRERVAAPCWALVSS